MLAEHFDNLFVPVNLFGHRHGSVTPVLFSQGHGSVTFVGFSINVGAFGYEHFHDGLIPIAASYMKSSPTFPTNMVAMRLCIYINPV